MGEYFQDYVTLGGEVRRQYCGEPITDRQYREMRKREQEQAKSALDPPHDCPTIQRLSEGFRSVKHEIANS